MMKTNIKIISLVLILAFSVSLFASCSSNTNTKDTENNNIPGNETGSSNNDEISADISGNGRENTPDTLPDGLDFSGETLRILLRDDEMYQNEIFSESEIGEIVNDAIFRRNQSVEERLNMTFGYIPIPQGNFNNSVKSSVNSGSDDYDLIAGFAYYIPPLSLENILMNWRNMPHIDLSRPWWSEDCTNELTVDGKLYFITGDFSLALVQSLYVYYFNKQMAQDFSIPNLYEIVLDGKWTFSKFAEISKSIKNDLNGDGIFDENDQYGYVAWEYANVDGYFAAFDQPITAKNADGFPELVVNTERTANIIDMVRDVMHNDGIYYNKADKDTVVPGMFMNGQNLFYYSDLYDSGTIFKSMESDYGILPCPKYDENQQEYKTVSHDIYSLFCVPSTCDKRELVGAASEAMAAESYRKVTPTYFETALKVKYSRDEETSQMLDIVLNGATFNFGVVYSSALDNVGYIMRDLLLFGDRNKSFAAYWEKREARYVKALDSLNEKFLDLSGD